MKDYKKVDILDVPFLSVNLSEAVDYVDVSIKQNKKTIVGFVNPEIVIQAKENSLILDFYKNKSSANFADGVGVIWASKILSERSLKDRVTGTDFVPSLCKLSENKSYKLYFLGGAMEVAKKAVSNLQKEYPKAKVVGFNHGYFSKNENDSIIKEINRLNTDILMVCLGCPKQEKWIMDNYDKLDVKVVFGNGGALDYYAGAVKRAPNWMQKFGLEWLFRIGQDFSFVRLKRQLRLIKFVLLIIIQKFINKKSNL